ncbi:Methyltransferase domain-containing protein [Lachnospiraceae bacterium NE2001]|nr:Methyltransferase domain-containing protein [Lachnospiraceae bacterium NE2001]
MEKWYEYLYYTENVAVNIERVDKVEDITGRETLQYVLRSLSILDKIILRDNISEEYSGIVRRVLQWSEVAKGGTAKDRTEWLEAGLPLDIHNIASAEIYRGFYPEDNATYILIKTHGMIGQCLRGEVPVSCNDELLELVPVLGEKRLKDILYILNECIIAAVSDELWERVGDAAKTLIDQILNRTSGELDAAARVSKLLPKLGEPTDELIRIFEEKYFPEYELWYFEAALSDFNSEQLVVILTRLNEVIAQLSVSGEQDDASDVPDLSYISFKPLADSLYYDYEGKKHINVYKKRIIEKYLKDASTENVDLDAKVVGGALLVDFKFSKVCEKLIEFCVEAERSGLLTFEKSITVLYDMFGFRRDEFDRLNNEDKYLSTMNDADSSTKYTTLDYVKGESVVDVGSGGGVLLDKLEEKYPDKKVIGTDISANVIEVLNKKKRDENHNWTVVRHNFVDSPFAVDDENTNLEKVDTVIFSSILHEIFSYTETPEGRFNIETVKKSLKNAYDSLKPGGRIIIRDGVKTPINDDILTVTFKEKSGLDFFKNYLQDFEGLTDIEDKRIEIDEENLRVRGCVNYIREFLYTYTWGQESYSHEVQEQFGYFTIADFKEFFENLGAKIIRADSFLEPGYPEHLRDKVTLEPDIYPDSNCIVVVEK